MQTTKELVYNPDHYQSCSEYTREIVGMFVPEKWHDKECIVMIKSLSYIRQDYHINHAIEYLWRVGKKDDPIVDLNKAKWYLQDRNEMFPTGKSRNDIACQMIDDLIQKLK
jgi:hypothetical protein